MSGAASSSWPFWSHYVTYFVKQDGRVIDPDRNSMTTSEGQSYAMFFALVANDRTMFERLRSWTEGNLAKGDLSKNLPAWSWGAKPDGSWGVLDPNSASDADLWTAYDLIEAGDLWAVQQYSNAGAAMLALIAGDETATLPNLTKVLLPGNAGFHWFNGKWLLNPSYTPVPLLLAANRVDKRGPWKQILNAFPIWLGKASPSGFAMDWVEYTLGTGFAPTSAPGDTRTARGSYDAIRVYLWAGMSPREVEENTQLLQILKPMQRYVEAHMSPPESVNPDGSIASEKAPPGFAAAMVPFLVTEGDADAATFQLRNVLAQFDSVTGLLGHPPRYFDQNLALFALGWQDGRFRFAPDGRLRVQWKN